MRHKVRSVRLGSRRLRAFYLIGIMVWLSGSLWLFFHYFLTKQGEFGTQINPLEPWWLKLHGAFAFAATWLFGLLWAVHITPAWRRNRRRLSGGALTGLFIWLIVSGYLLYYVGDDRLRPLVSIGHWALGLAGPLLYWIHRLKKRRRLQTTRLANTPVDPAL